MKTLILSGISGSGKTTFLRALEDAGYFCVDNFPLVLLRRFSEFFELTREKIQKFALVVDIREKEFFDEGKDILGDIKGKYSAELLFLESSEEAVMKRFRETRRSHPLFGSSNVKDALNEERILIRWIKDIADKVIDTSQLTPHELRRFVLNTYGHDEKRMKINIMSFGYAYGIPLEADMVLDVRFLPNPFFVDGLKDKTGLSGEVQDYIRTNADYTRYFAMLVDFLIYLMPLFEKEGKSYLTICLGCTGGKHRSVFIVNELSEQLAMMNYGVSAIHRDIGR
jgi:RNase adapter protein RapZ